jgi:transmembrane sensor
MNNPSEYLHVLFLKYSSGEATAEEAEEFLRLVSQEISDREMIRRMEALIDETIPEKELDHQRWSKVFRKIEQQTIASSRRSLSWRKISIAASVAVVFVSAGLLIYNNNQQRHLSTNVPNTEITPGQNKATLTLANGKKIKLTDEVNGKLAEESGVIITKTASGELVYELKARSSGKDANNINTLSTSNGETYHVRLPDQSDVWLNAGSSLSYNVSLIQGGERKVKLTGEGYFEVTKDKTHPFIVVSDRQQIRVLGTHFNVNAYADEPVVKTALLEGSVQISSSDGQLIKMKPGQQVSLTGTTFSIADVDTDDAVAWTKGQLQFNDKTVPEIMRQIAKWYDVQVIFDGDIPEGEWSGSISRNRPLGQVLRMLEKSNGVKFRVEGKKLYVGK